MFRRPRSIVIAAAALYVIALHVAWLTGGRRADRRTEEMLLAAEESFGDTINGEIEAALCNVGGAIINTFDGKCRPQTIERMQELARTFNLDEINFVDARGIAVASNLRSVLGADYTVSPLTREFLSLTNATTTMVSQPFRPGVANPEMTCKYYGMPFPGHGAFIQLGMTMDRLRQNMYSFTRAEADEILREWHFNGVGWYERAAEDPAFESGRIFTRWSDVCQEKTVGRYFDYYGNQYRACLPLSYCYAQRNASFLVTALVLTVLISLFAFMLVRLAKASARVEALHAAAEARTAADLALARTIQMAVLPPADGVFHDWLEFSVRAGSLPAREVGGDFYDFYPLPDGRIVFLVADVSGKGIPGAMFMMEAKNVLKNCLVEHVDVAEAVREANRQICESNRAELFVTAWIGVLDPKTGALEYVNAGHCRPFVRRADGTVEKVMGKGGRFLGMFEDAAYRVNALRLGPGDLLYLYTDGVTEAMNARHEPFGEARLREALGVSDWEVHQAVADFVGGNERSDDATELSLRWYGEPARQERTFACTEASLGEVVAFVRAALAGTDAKSLAAALNAADEIVANIVYYSEAAEYCISVEKGTDRLRLRFSDDGKAYNPLSHVDPDTHAAIEERPVGGLGLVVVKRLADRVAYAREDGRNVLTLIRRLPSAD